jgi:putative transcription factor
MQCEICGAEIKGSPNRILVDGSSLDVCKSCARFGKAEDKWSPVPRKMAPVERSFAPVRKPRPARDEFREMPDIVPDFGRKVREARESLGLDPEKLGVRIKEKSTLIRKIEREEIIPEDSVRKKLEKELNIKLTDQVTDAKVKASGGAKGLTLGDIANIKRR